MTRYVEAFSWPGTIQEFLDSAITERPLWNVCSGTTKWGHVRVDKFMPADLQQDWTELSVPEMMKAPAAIFADPPWDGAYKRQCATFIKRALTIAPVVYLMAPWMWGSAERKLTKVWVREMPGVNPIVAIMRFERKPTPRAPETRP